MSNLSSLTSAQLIKAASIKDKIEALTKELNAILGSPAVAESTVKPAKKSGMSEAGRAKIIAAQKLRWQKVNAVKKPAKTVVKPAAKKRTMSAAAKAKIAAAAKARWAKVKAAGKKTL